MSKTSPKTKRIYHVRLPEGTLLSDPDGKPIEYNAYWASRKARQFEGKVESFVRELPVPIFTTAPHGEHTLTYCPDSPYDGSDPSQPIDNSLFTLTDSRLRELTFTGEELDSLAAQWVAYRTDKQ